MTPLVRLGLDQKSPPAQCNGTALAMSIAPTSTDLRSGGGVSHQKRLRGKEGLLGVRASDTL